MAWELPINLAGIAPAGVFTEIPEGAYKVVIEAADAEKAKDDAEKAHLPRIVIRFRVIEPEEHAGNSRRKWLRVPDPSDPKDKVLHFWRALMESIGYGAAALDGGMVKLSDSLFVGKTGYIYYTPGNRELKVYENSAFITAAEYNERRRLALAQAAVQGTATVTRPADPSGVTVTPPNRNDAAVGNGLQPSAAPSSGDLLSQILR